MNDNNTDPDKQKNEPKLGLMKVVGLLAITVLVTALVTAFAIKTYIFPGEFKPVKLNTKEEKTLRGKLKSLDLPASLASQGDKDISQSNGRLAPKPFSEKGATREIQLSENELNALLAKNTDLARKLAIDLSDNLVSAKLLLPVDEDFPILGGKTLRVKAGLQLDYHNGNPRVVLMGISIMGVPVPNAWMGNIKNVDLVGEFGNNPGFWKNFAAGIEYLHVEEGFLKVKLKK